MAGEEIGGQGHMGIAFEATAGTYTAPTKWFPVADESLVLNAGNEERRVIRGIVDSLGSTPTDIDVSGNIKMEVLSDVLPYFLYAGRYTVTKTGIGPFEYSAVGNHEALPTAARTLSIHVIRAGVVFAYTGCVVGSLEFSTDNGKLMVNAGIVGRDESTETIGTPAYTNEEPFSKGMYTITIAAVGATDIDEFTIGVNDNAAPAHRLKNTRTPEFVHFGERNISGSFSRDFNSRAEYDLFKATTTRAISVLASRSANDQVLLEVPAAVMNTYEVPLSAQGDLVRAAIDLHGDYDATVTAGARIVVDTPTEDIT